MVKVGMALYSNIFISFVPPGITALLALGVLESMEEQGLIKPLLEMEHNSVEYLHALVEAMRLAFAGTSLQ